MKSLVLAITLLISVADSRITWKRHTASDPEANPPPFPCQQHLMQCVNTHAPGVSGPSSATCQQMIDVMNCTIPHLPTCDTNGMMSQILTNVTIDAAQPPHNCDFSGVTIPTTGGNDSGNGGVASAPSANEANKRQSVMHKGFPFRK